MGVCEKLNAAHPRGLNFVSATKTYIVQQFNFLSMMEKLQSFVQFYVAELFLLLQRSRNLV